MASTRSESTPLLIALILFVVLSIVLGVTTFMFYKAEEDALRARQLAVQNEEAAEQKSQAAREEADKLKQLVEPEQKNSDVKAIMENYKQDQQEYGETYEKNKDTGVNAEPVSEDPSASTYPDMLRYLIDANKALHTLRIQREQQLDDIKKDHAAEKEKLIAEHKVTQDQLDEMSSRVRAVQEAFNADRTSHENKYKKATDNLREAQDKVTEVQDEQRRRENKLSEKINEQNNQLKATRTALSNSRKVDLEAPDGEIVGIDQGARRVYIDLGRGDGVRRQTTFSVYPHDVVNALTAEPKGAIEVVRVGENISVAKVTSERELKKLSKERLVDPIRRGDKIISTVYHRGQPEHFAIAGKIDLDADGRSDLPLLLRLIEQNGGIVDTFIDALGNVGGEGVITPRTKYLVMGEKPTDKSEEDFLNAYNKMVQAAVENGVRIMPLKDLLDHMGYQGQGRSVNLGRTANPDDFKPSDDGAVFRRRPAG